MTTVSKISGSGQKRMVVPVVLECPTIFIFWVVLPRENCIS